MANVTIRATEVEDCQGIAELHQCPEVLKGTLRMPYQSVASMRSRLESMPKTTYSLVAIAKEDNKIVGNLSLVCYSRARQHVAGIRMAVRDDYHGQGIPAVHLYKKFDFEIEGTLKKYAFRAGNYVDAYTMARIV